MAGPYSAPDVMVNIRGALDAAEQVVDLGHVPYIPHLTGFWHLIHPRPYEWWLAFDIQWLLVCDVLLRLPGESGGADREVDVARANGIPVVYALADLPPATGQLVGFGLGAGGD